MTTLSWKKMAFVSSLQNVIIRWEYRKHKWAFYKKIHEYVGGNAQKRKPQHRCLKPAQTLSIHPLFRRKKKLKKEDTTERHESGILTERLWQFFPIGTTSWFKPKTLAKHDQLSMINHLCILTPRNSEPRISTSRTRHKHRLQWAQTLKAVSSPSRKWTTGNGETKERPSMQVSMRGSSN